jgi:hypothetical protein
MRNLTRTQKAAISRAARANAIGPRISGCPGLRFEIVSNVQKAKSSRASDRHPWRGAILTRREIFASHSPASPVSNRQFLARLETPLNSHKKKARRDL